MMMVNMTHYLKQCHKLNHVSVWNFYPDPDANNMDEAQFVIERHKMSTYTTSESKKRPYVQRQCY